MGTMKFIHGHPDWYLSDRQRHESYEGSRRLLTELPLVGRMQLLDALPNSLVAHTHENIYEIHCVLRGPLGFWVGKETFHVGAGMAFITRPGELHGGINDALSPGEWFWIHIRFPEKGPLPGLSVNDCNRFREVLDTTPHRVFQASQGLRNCFARLLEEHRAISPFGELMARLAYHELLVWLIRDLSPVSAPEHAHLVTYAIRSAIRWIDEHLMEPFSISTVAAAVGLSQSGFRRRFHQEMAQSPAEYVTQQRILRARQLLRETDRSITEIALDLGFNSSPYFAAVFKRITGQTPSAFRSSCSGKSQPDRS